MSPDVAYLWYVQTPGFPRVPIGVYSSPPPSDAQPGVQFATLDASGDAYYYRALLRELRRYTRLKDRVGAILDAISP